MKQLLFYTGLSIILVAAFSSCSSEVETTSSLAKNAGIINRNRNNSASCTDNKRITLKISEIREIAI